MSGHQQHDRETEQPNDELEYLRERVEELEGELLNVRIDNAGKERFINQMATERKELITQVTDMSYKLGAAQTKLQHLEAPRQEPQAGHVETAGETVPREAEVMPSTTPTQATAPEAAAPAPEAQPQPEKRGFFGRLFK